MRTTLKYNNFSSGLIDKNLQGRVDLSIYNNSLQQCRNFLIQATGNVEYRGGFSYESTGDNSNYEYFTLNFTYSEFKDFIIKIYPSGTDNIKIYSKDSNNTLQLFQQLTDSELGYNYKNLSYANYYNKLIIANYNFKPKELNFNGTDFSIAYFTINVVMSSGQTPPFMQNTNGYPNKICFYQNRLCFFSTKERATTIFVSDFNDINTYTFRLSSDELYNPSIDGFYRPILYLTSKPIYVKQNQNYIAVFSSTESIVIVSNGEFTATTSEPYRLDIQGIRFDVEPFLYNNSLIFLDSSGQNLKVLDFSYESQSYRTVKLNSFYKDYFRIPIKKVAVKEDIDTIYFLRSDGLILNLKLDLINNVNAPSIIKLNDNFVINNLYSIYRNDYIKDVYIDLKVGNNLYICKYNYNLTPAKDKNDFLEGEDETKEYLNYVRYIQGYNLGLCYLDLFQDLTVTDPTIRFDFSDEKYLKKADSSSWSTDEENSQFKIYDNNRELYCILNTYKINPDNSKEIEFEIKTKNFKVSDLPTEYVTVKNVKQLDLTNTIYYQNETLRNLPLTIVGDGVEQKQFTLAQSPIIDFELLNINIGIILIGYKYDGIIILNNMGYDFNGQTTQITLKQVKKITLRLNNSKGGKIGTDFYRLQDIQYPDYNDLTETARLSENFDTEVEALDTYDKVKAIYIKQDKPYPLNIDMVCVKMDSQL